MTRAIGPRVNNNPLTLNVRPRIANVEPLAANALALYAGTPNRVLTVVCCTTRLRIFCTNICLIVVRT